jgi:hypothetical protein
MHGIDAAYLIFSWEEVTLSIQNECPQKDNKINSDLQPIILEAMRLKDEADDEQAEKTDDETDIHIESTGQKETINIIDKIRIVLNKEVGERCGLEDIFQDNSMEKFILSINELGARHNLGSLKIGYLDQGTSADTIFLTGQATTLIKVNPKCPRDKIIQVLGENF